MKTCIEQGMAEGTWTFHPLPRLNHRNLYVLNYLEALWTLSFYESLITLAWLIISFAIDEQFNL